MAYSLVFLRLSFHEKMWIDEVKFIILYSFVCIVSCMLKKKSLRIFKSKLLFCLLHQNCYGSFFFLVNMLWGSRFEVSFSLTRSCSGSTCWHDFPFHIVLPGCYSSKMYVLCLGFFCYSSAVNLSDIIPVPHVFNGCSFIVGFEVRRVSVLSTFKKRFLLIS